MAENLNLNSNSKAVLRFLPNWQEADEGEISRGDRVAIEFAPERLTGCRRNWRGAEVWDIEALARFYPRGEILRGSLLDRIRTGGVVTSLIPKPTEFAVPSDARRLEIWFHNFAAAGGHCDAWDSRFGENYWFDVGGPEPMQSQDPVRYRDGAMPRPDLVNVVDQFAIKRNVFPAPPNGPPVGKDLRTSLTLRVWVKNLAYAKAVWIDLHIFDRSGTRIAAATYGLPWEGSASGIGDLFRFDGEIYQGLTATPGSVSPKPNAWLVQYRLYYAVEGQTYTDTILHQLELPDDAVS
jgi:hypothetical protein